MTPPEHSTLAVQLERMGADLGEIKTACAVLVERSNRTEQDVRDLRKDTDDDIKALRAEVEDVKRWRWMATGAAVVVGTAAGYIANIVTG